MAIHIVKKNQPHAYETIQQAIDVAKPGDCIEIHPGIYQEKVLVNKEGLLVRGDDPSDCILQWGDYAEQMHEDGRTYGTFRTYTCLVQADNVTFENLTIENTAGDGREVGQAVALYADGDRLTFNHCRFLGHQDTIFTAPLPEAPKIPDSFRGPSDGRSYRRQEMYFKDCQITGDVDYIFGSALVLFRGCTMITKNRHEKVNGYVTAPSTWQGEPYGYVFLECSFIGEDQEMRETVYLGRPWRPYGQVLLKNCITDRSIHRDWWDPWGNQENFNTAKLIEAHEGELDFISEWHRSCIRKH